MSKYSLLAVRMILRQIVCVVCEFPGLCQGSTSPYRYLDIMEPVSTSSEDAFLHACETSLRL